MLKELLGLRSGIPAGLLAVGLWAASAAVHADVVGADSPAASLATPLTGGDLTPADLASFADTAGGNPYVLFANSLSMPTAQNRQTQIESVVFNFDAAHGISPESMPVPIPPPLWLLLSAIILLPIVRQRTTDSA